MSTAVTPAPHVSWLKKFGQEVGKIIGVVAKEAVPIEQKIVPIAEAILPGYAPEIALAAGIFEKAADMIATTEAAFLSVGQGSNGVAKFSAVLSIVGNDIEEWVHNKFPGSAAIVTGEQYLSSKAGLVNAVVAFLNGIDASSINVAPTSSAIAAAAAAHAALSAASPAK